MNNPKHSARGAYLLGLTLALFTVLLGSACSSYRMGPPGGDEASPFRSVYVELIKNESFAPQAQAPLSDQLAETFMTTANVRTVDKGEAQATLTVVLKEYKRSMSATQSRDTVQGQSFTLTLISECTLLDNRTGKYYFKNRTISTSMEAYVYGGFGRAEYESMPVLARDLARKIVDASTSGW